jgi:hypothetical protein
MVCLAGFASLMRGMILGRTRAREAGDALI